VCANEKARLTAMTKESGASAPPVPATLPKSTKNAGADCCAEAIESQQAHRQGTIELQLRLHGDLS
jgi:hypothetical protein